jgi:hypothetical protein
MRVPHTAYGLLSRARATQGMSQMGHNNQTLGGLFSPLITSPFSKSWSQRWSRPLQRFLTPFYSYNLIISRAVVDGGTFMAWNIRGLENPSSDEFLKNPDL